MVSFRYDPATASLKQLASTSEGAKAPLFVMPDPTGQVLFVADHMQECNGVPGGAVAAYAICPDEGSMRFINRAPTHGSAPCYINVTQDGRFLAVANYSTGTVSILSRNADGGPDQLIDQIDHSPFGKGPHAHCALLSDDERFLLCADLGVDRVFVHRFDKGTGKLALNDPPATETAAGAGPRHLAFSPDRRFVFAMTEYDNTAIAMHWDAQKGAAPLIGAKPALPADFTQVSYGSDIFVHPNGRSLYVSNRGHESIAVFAIDDATGELSRLQIEPIEGKFPRSMALDPAGKHLLVGSEQTDCIVIFDVDAETGKITRREQTVALKRPAQLRLV